MCEQKARMIIYVSKVEIILTCLIFTEKGWVDNFQQIVYEDAEVVSTNLIWLEKIAPSYKLVNHIGSVRRCLW